MGLNNYCITLDKIDSEHYEEIFACKEQLTEWRELFDVDVKSTKDLKEEKYLVLDTKFFDMKFKYKLLSKFANLDVDIDGVLVNSENFGALNLLQSRYKEQVKTVYIDPPYNTGNDGFLYNDSFQHSSWMSFMYDRLALGRELMSDDGVIFSSIDDKEQVNFRNLKNIIFRESNFLSEFTRTTKKAGKSSEQISKNHDTVICYQKTNQLNLNGFEHNDSNFKHSDKYENERGLYKLNQTLDYGSIQYSASLDYEIELKGETLRPGNVSKEEMMERQGQNPKSDFCWRWSKDLFEYGLKNGFVVLKKYDNYSRIYTKTYQKATISKRGKEYFVEIRPRVKSISTLDLIDNKYSNDNSSKDLSKLFENSIFNYSKPIELLKTLCFIGTNSNSTILDYFAGSGTTGHAVINLNREDKGKRKYILVEMGEYFDSVTKPRIQKVIYSDSWKDGKPTTKNGISQIFKYFKLESYEDSLNNLEFKRTEEQQKALDFYPQAKEDYMLNYSLDVESQSSLLNIDTFSTPFDYKLKIATSSVGETKDTNIDLIETFNYLLGLVVKRIELLKGYLIVEGQNLKKEKILIIWRNGQNSNELNEFFQNMNWLVYDRKFDTIYVNGDNNLDKLRTDEEHYKVKLIEQEFKDLMFGE